MKWIFTNIKSNGKGLLEFGSFYVLFDKLSNVLLSSDVDNKFIWKTNSNCVYLFKSSYVWPFIISWSVHLILFNQVWKGFVPLKIESFFFGWLFSIKSILDEFWLSEIFLKLVMHFDHYVSRTRN